MDTGREACQSGDIVIDIVGGLFVVSRIRAPHLPWEHLGTFSSLRAAMDCPYGDEGTPMWLRAPNGDIVPVTVAAERPRIGAM
jgi:hypothetical protein